MGDEQQAPERIFLKACHPASPNHNCTWSVSETPEDSVEYLRVDLAGQPSFEEQQLAKLYEDPHPGYDCAGTCVIHSTRFAVASQPDLAPVAQPPDDEAD